ncbi:hypothetical protein ANOM_003958 [Aspergillus nomiae NRRL 13137]|uniref:CFEM domain-containing protein n=1 Tax=Aspergillus nomiae NRRL (strain ATCC 15546 / NRRL 13137 / CBS 260.88 / M93) TaxID=1509407 RepID=A0A0L1J6E9_ASPN3|nr:uncharacterized protein ANOM_003958 [Aspergillus nomiae NRRL 13137]KNG87317.1 hypothetical protein ANOM_003958 [Aspergillus nomiae NRRL 13137]
MLSSLLQRLPTLFLSLALPLLALGAYGQKLPAARLDTVPDCALNCVESFINTDYPNNACSSVSDISCLCKTNTKSGYTLGEAALRCGFSFCSIEVALNSSVYSICDSVPGALPRTHATITATVVSVLSPTSVPATETHSPNSSLTTPTDPTPPQTGHPSTTFTTFQSPVSATDTEQSTSSTASSSQTTHNATSGAAAGKESSLNAGAVIGVSVSSGIAGFFILGVIVFFCCRKMKRRYQQPKDHDFFEIGGAMAEPPDFSLPPRRPTPGPNPSSGAGHGDTETSRLMSPFQPGPQNPAVVVTGPGDDYRYGSTGIDSPGRIGFAISSSSDLEPSVSQSSPRTVSDLLPDKPVYTLCPEPLRLSQPKYTRPTSGDTLFEEDVTRPRSFLGGNRQYPTYANMQVPYRNNRQYKRPPRVGLPDNPRALFHAFRARNNTVIPIGSGCPKKPVYVSAGEGVQVPYQSDLYGKSSPLGPQPYNTERNGYVGDYLRGLDVETARALPEPPVSRNAVRHLDQEVDTKDNLLDSSSDEFETININESSGSHRTSRHSGNFRPLTPVREIRTPKNDGQRRNYFDEDASVKFPRMPFSRAVSPAREIVSRPRIVRRDDIKRVQIRRGKPQPKELTIPYSPDDYWNGHSRSSPSGPRPYRLSGDRSSTEIQGRMAKKKRSSSERNLTPSRRGSDLILRVD